MMENSVPAPLRRFTLLPVHRRYFCSVGCGGVSTGGGVLSSGDDSIEEEFSLLSMEELWPSFSGEMASPLLHPAAMVNVSAARVADNAILIFRDIFFSVNFVF